MNQTCEPMAKNRIEPEQSGDSLPDWAQFKAGKADDADELALHSEINWFARGGKAVP